ncbi:MAG: helix-turn-helix transcriptional regulator [Clostridia bacterium]|nr:helix-turn-helix transcriptional regulator [Clostridia bacterium]
MKFTERFNEALIASGKTQAQIAKEIKVCKQCVSDYKAGKSFPSLETLYLICQSLDVSADYLLGISNEL